MAKTRTIVRYARRKKTNKRKSFTLPMAIVGGFAVPVVRGYNLYKTSGLSSAMTGTASWFTGYDASTGNWLPERLTYGLLPVGVGIMVHKLASAFGVNRAIAAAGIPLLRI